MNQLRGEFTFKVGKKKYDAVLTLNSLRLMCQHFKVPIDKIQDWMGEDALTAVPAFCYYGVKNFALRKGKKAELPDFDVWCAQALDDPDTLDQMMKAVSSALGADEEAEPGN
jgi:hypothetical protein